MSSYGGSAALVVNKQETDRERRLRLRREEFAKRSGLVASPPPHQQNNDRQDVHPQVEESRSEQADGKEIMRPADGGRDREGYLGAAKSHDDMQDPNMDAKKRRYLELRSKLQPEEQEALDAKYNLRVYQELQEKVKDPPTLMNNMVGKDVGGEMNNTLARHAAGNPGDLDTQLRFNAALPPPRAGRNAEGTGELDQLDMLYDQRSSGRADRPVQRAPAPPSVPVHQWQAPDAYAARMQDSAPEALPREDELPPTSLYKQRQQEYYEDLHSQRNQLSQRFPARDPLREVQAVRAPGAGVGGLFGGGLGFGGVDGRQEEAVARKREYAAYLKQQMQEKSDQRGVGGQDSGVADKLHARHFNLGRQDEAAGVGSVDKEAGAGSGMTGAALNVGGAARAQDILAPHGASVGWGGGGAWVLGNLGVGLGGNQGVDKRIDEKRRYAEELQRQAEDDKRRKEREKRYHEGEAVSVGVDGAEKNRPAGEMHMEDGMLARRGGGVDSFAGHLGAVSNAADTISGARRSPGPPRSAAIRDARSMIGAALVVGGEGSEKEETELKKQRYAQELRRQVELEREKKEQQKREESERERREEEKMRLALAREQHMLNIPKDQFGNPLPGHAPAPLHIAAGGLAEGNASGGVRNRGPGAPDAAQPAVMCYDGVSGDVGSVLTPPGGRKGGKGGLAARAVKEEGMPMVVSHEAYKEEIKRQIAEKKRQQDEQRQREEEQERLDNERLQRQIREMQEQTDKEQQRRKQKEEAAEAQRQAILARGSDSGGGGGQLLSRTPPPSAPPVHRGLDVTASGHKYLGDGESSHGGGGADGVGEGAGGDFGACRPSVVEPLPDNPDGGVQGDVSGAGGDRVGGSGVGSLSVVGENEREGVDTECASALSFEKSSRHDLQEEEAGLRNRGLKPEGRRLEHGSAGRNVSNESDPGFLLRLYGAEGSVEQTLAALRADLVREHTRLQQELGLAPSSQIADLRMEDGRNQRSQGGEDNLIEPQHEHVVAQMQGAFPAAGGRGYGQDAARGGRAWAGRKGVGGEREWGDVSEYVNVRAPREDAGPRSRRRWDEGGVPLRAEAGREGSYMEELLDGNKVLLEYSDRGLGAARREERAGIGSLKEVGSLAAARESAEALAMPAGAVMVRGVVVPSLEAGDAKYLVSPTKSGFDSRRRDRIKNPAREWVLHSADLKYLSTSVDLESKDTSASGDAAKAAVSKVHAVSSRPPTGVKMGSSRPMTAASLPAGEVLSPSLALDVAAFGLESRATQGGNSGDGFQADEEPRFHSRAQKAEDVPSQQVADDSVDRDEEDKEGCVERMPADTASEEVRTLTYDLGDPECRQHADAKPEVEFRLEKGRRRVAMLDDDDLQTSGHVDQSEDRAAGSAGSEAPDESDQDVAEPPRCDSPEITKPYSQSRLASARPHKSFGEPRPLAEQSLASASALVAPDASLSLLAPGSRPATRGGDGVGGLMAIPAGARGLGTPNSMRRAAAIAQTMFDDSFDDAGDDDDSMGNKVDQSLSGASFLVALHKGKKKAGRDVGNAFKTGDVSKRDGGYSFQREGEYENADSVSGTMVVGENEGPGGEVRRAWLGPRGRARPVSASKLTTSRLRAAGGNEIDYLLQKFVDSRPNP